MRLPTSSLYTLHLLIAGSHLMSDVQDEEEWQQNQTSSTCPDSRRSGTSGSSDQDVHAHVRLLTQTVEATSLPLHSVA